MGVSVSGDFDDEDSDDLLQRNMTSADRDEAFIGYLDVRSRQFFSQEEIVPFPGR